MSLDNRSIKHLIAVARTVMPVWKIFMRVHFPFWVHMDVRSQEQPAGGRLISLCEIGAEDGDKWTGPMYKMVDFLALLGWLPAAGRADQRRAQGQTISQRRQ